MNVFTDFHHAGLLNSLIMLFEGRFGGKVYRPIGMEWAEKGYWKVYDHPATQLQFLGIGGATPDSTPKLNEVVNMEWENVANNEFIYHCQDIDSGQTNKGITYEGFMSMPFDFIIASLPQHIEPFYRLAQQHPNHPKLIYQIGNAWNLSDYEAQFVKNVMASAIIPPVPAGVNFVEYHQEFDLNVFHYAPPADGKRISSFVNVFGSFPDWPLFEKVEKLLPDWEFRSYGGQCRDGAAHGAKEVAQRMRDARFIWHTKAGGDGYGHVVFSSAAVGRPLIVHKGYYAGKLAEKLMVPAETCIAIDMMNPNEIAGLIDYYNDEDRYAKLVQNVYQNFRATVDFNEDAKKIKNFLDNAI